jgi:hypothetical protein
MTCRNAFSAAPSPQCYDRGILVSELGGEIRYEGFQVFLSFRF